MEDKDEGATALPYDCSGATGVPGPIGPIGSVDIELTEEESDERLKKYSKPPGDYLKDCKCFTIDNVPKDEDILKEYPGITKRQIKLVKEIVDAEKLSRNKKVDCDSSGLMGPTGPVDGSYTLIPFEVKNNCCITKCEFLNINVSSVPCKECEYYKGEKDLHVKCSHPQNYEEESTKEKK